METLLPMDSIARGIRAVSSRHSSKKRGLLERQLTRILNVLHWKRCSLRGRVGFQAQLTWRILAHNLTILTRLRKPIAPAKEAA